MPPLYRTTPAIGAAILSFVVMTIMGFVPLFAGPGYESSLAAGLLLPSIVAAATALTVSHHLPAPNAGFVRGIEIAFVVLLIGYITTLAHGLRVGFCDVPGGTALFALGPGLGTLLAGTWGIVAGEIAGRMRRRWVRVLVAVSVAMLAPVATILVSLWRFYASPIVFAYDPFFGFFSGALYDTVVTDALPTLLSYRAGTMATLFAAGAVAELFQRQPRGSLAFGSHRHPGVVWFAVGATAVSVIITIEGARLGHWQTSDTIARALGGQVVDERCEVIYPRSLSDEDARLLLRDCATQSRQIIHSFGLQEAPRVRAYVFADRAVKRALMGASGTSIAKPWRNEIYIQLAGYPHPIMGHELAHVLSGTFGRGPFRIAGGMGGLLPNPGLIEGMAVAAAPDDDVLTPAQWASSMLKLELLPPLSTVFALSFLGEYASKSYTTAGAFVMWVRERYGIEVVRRWYGGEAIEQLTQASLEELEQAWHTDLSRMPIGDAALQQARARFDRPGVFRRTCPHAVDELVTTGRSLASQGDCTGASAVFSKATTLDAQNPWSRVGLAHCSARLNGVEEAIAEWQRIVADESLPPVAHHAALEALGDLHLATGQTERARRAYRKLAEATVNDERLRTLDVKTRAAQNPLERRAVAELLVGGPGRPPNHKFAFALLGKWMADLPADGLAAYLIGRNLMSDGLWKEAADYLDWALERRLPEGRVAREALRLRVIAACAQRDDAVARKAYRRWRQSEGLTEIQWQVLEARLGSCISDAATAR